MKPGLDIDMPEMQLLNWSVMLKQITLKKATSLHQGNLNSKQWWKLTKQF